MRKSVVVVTGLLLALTAPLAAQQNKETRPGYIGLRSRVDREVVNDRGTERVVVVEVSPDAPAAKAGVRANDVIVRINGLVPTNGKFDAVARTLVEGDTVRLLIKRNGREREHVMVATARPTGYATVGSGNRVLVFSGDSLRHLMLRFLDSARVHLDSLRLPSIHITPGDSLFDVRVMPYHGLLADSIFLRRHNNDTTLLRMFKARPGEMFGYPKEFHRRWQGDLGPDVVFRSVELGARSIAGAEFTELDPAMEEYFGTERGLLTLRVAPQTPAARAGLQPGDVVVKADDRAIAAVSELRRIIASRREGVKLEVVRKGERKNVELKTRIREED